MKKVSLEKVPFTPRWGYIATVLALLVGVAFVSYRLGSDPVIINVTEYTVDGSSSDVPRDVLTPHASSDGLGFNEMTAAYDKLTADAQSLQDAVQVLIDHPVENPRVQTVPDWQWVDIVGLGHESIPASDGVTCGIEMGGTLTEIGTLGNQILVRYGMSSGLSGAGTPCDGGEVFFINE